MSKNWKLERELKLKEILAGTSGTMLSLYVIVFAFLGKSLFELTSVGYFLIFLPFFLLGLSAVLSATSIVTGRRILRSGILLLVFTAGVFSIAVTLFLVYRMPEIFWD